MKKLQEAHNFRKTFNKDKDDIIYIDDEYVIFSKDTSITGNLGSSLDIAVIGINGVRNSLDHFLSIKDRNEIIDTLIELLVKQKYEEINP